MRIVTGCLCPTPTNYLPILAGILPTELRRQGATLYQAYRSLIDLKHLLHQLMVGPITAHEDRLRFQHLFVPVARELLNELSKLNIQAAQQIDYKWDEKCSEKSKLRLFDPRPSARPLEMGLPRPAWVRLNRFCTGVRKFQLSMHKWGLAPTSICGCGSLHQTDPT